MQRAVVAIGVKKTGGLPELQAAQSTAAAVADWARTHQKIPASRVKLITDEKRRVTRDRIFETIAAITELGCVEQLIVYFSGHGINSGMHEQWLLSQAPDDPAAAVNLSGSEMLARYCGIGHVIFISDACRTAADSIQAQSVTGGEIFPNRGVLGGENPVDQYFATLVGNPAYEVKTVEDAVKRYRAAYSAVLLAALKGNVASIIEMADSRRVIRPRPLKKHLAVAVPDYIAALNLPSGVTQQPDARLESEPEAWIAELPGPTAAPPPAAAPKRGIRHGARTPGKTATRELTGEEELPPPGVVTATRRVPDLASEAALELAAALDPAAATVRKRGVVDAGRVRAPGAARALLDRAVATGTVVFGPDHFETECGIKVRGARLAEAYARHAAVRVGAGRDVVQVNLASGRRGANVAVRLSDGSAVMVPAFRDYITGLTFGTEGNLDDMWCEPSANTARWRAWRQSAREIGALRAVIAACSSLGVFRFDDPAKGIALLRRMREVKGLDPAMAVYAAYAFNERRMRGQVVEMQQYLDFDLQTRIFDVAMLAFTLGRERDAKAPREMYPCIPMLTQGWALLSPLEITLPGRLGELRRHLRPSLWTHFTAAAVDVLVETLTNREVE